MKYIIRFNNFLSKFGSILNLTGVIIAIVALIIAVSSYRIANQKADLYLTYRVYDRDFMDDIQYENGEGTIEFVSDSKSDRYYRIGERVTICRPGSEVFFKLENKGNVAAKNPVINFKFNNMEFANLRDGWEGTLHNHGLGTWSEIRWQPVDNMVIHNGIPVRFDEFSFSESIVFEDASIEVIISADNAKTKKFNIPVYIRQGYNR